MLREYQVKAVDWIVKHPRCAVWAGCGMGKTLTVISAIRELRLSKVLIIAPKRVALTVWGQEIEKWAPELTYSIVMGTPKQRDVALKAQADVYITSYEQILRWQGPTAWNMVVCDESTRLRGYRSKQGAKIPKLISAFKAGRFVELTGTPAPKSYEDLWGQLFFLDGGLRLGKSYWNYINRYFYDTAPAFVDWHKWELRKGSMNLIQQACKDLCLSLNAADYFPLVEAQTHDIKCPMEEPKLYERLRKELAAEIDGQEVSVANAMVLSEKLLQLSSGFLYSEGDTIGIFKSSKVEAIESIISETDSSVIIAYRHKQTAAMLREAFNAVELTAQNVDSWNRGEIPVLLLNPASAGHGLNLQYGGHVMIWAEPTWNLEHYQQALERIGPTRQLQAGKKNVVQYYRIISSPIEQVVYDRLDGKAWVQSDLLRSVK